MSKPIISAITAFDAEKGTRVEFAWKGNAIVANELIIRDSETNDIVYQYKIANRLLYHDMNVEAGKKHANVTADFKNGKLYQATIKVYDSFNTSSESSPVTFWCFTTPVLDITNSDEIITMPSFYLNFEYSQADNKESLKEYWIELYDSNNQCIHESGYISVSSIIDESNKVNKFSYLIGKLENAEKSSARNTDDLENLNKYSVIVKGLTQNGMYVEAYYKFGVKYDRLGVGSLVNLKDIGDGMISIGSNFKIMNARCNPNPPKYIANEEIDLRGKGSYLEYFDGFSVSGDYTIKLILRSPSLGNICTVKNEFGDIIRLTYEYYDVGYEYIDENTNEEVLAFNRKYYFKLTVIGEKNNVVLHSELFDDPATNQKIGVLIQHKQGFYNLKTKFLGTSSGDSVINTYNITYHIDDGNAVTESITEGEDISSYLAEEKDTYNFIGWSTTPNASVEDIIDDGTVASQDIDLYAVFGKNVTLTYYDNSTTPNTKSNLIYYNNGNIEYPKYTMTQKASTSGMTERGWSTINKGDANISYLNGSTITVVSDITIYGLYSKSITLKYYDNGGATTKPLTRYWAPAGYINPQVTMTQSKKNGWTEAGWGTNSSGNAKAAYSNGAKITVTSDMTIYGLYYQEFTCTFKTYDSSSNQKGRNCYNSSGQTYSYVVAPTGTNVSYVIPGSEVSSAWTWRGWSAAGQTAGNASVAYANGETIAGASSGNVYYGLYHRKTAITYVQNGGSKSNATGDSYYNAYGNYSKAKFTSATINALSGWSIYGWSAANKTAANTEMFCGSGKSFEQASDATLYALYQRTITLSYNSNGGSGSMSSDTATQQYNVSSSGNVTSHTFTLKACEFTYVNNVFQLWAEGSVSGTKRAAGSTVSITNNTTYYAIWDANDISGQTLYSGTGGVDVRTGSFNTTGYSSVAITLIGSSGWGYYGLVIGQQSSVGWTQQGESGSITINLPANSGVQYFSWCVGISGSNGGTDENTSWKIVVSAS